MSSSIPPALAIYDPSFHEGVVGIVAGRLKDTLHRPVFVLARGQDGLVKGSGRSIPGFHLRDALDLISKRHPGLLLRFGGHAMAAGCTLQEQHVALFAQGFGQVAQEQLDAALLQRRLKTDGPLPQGHYSAESARLLESQVWGQGFEAPLFCDRMEVLQQRLLKDRHLRLMLRPLDEPAAAPREAIWFNRKEALPDRALLAYRIGVDEWQGRQRVQMFIEALAQAPEPANS